MDLKLGGYEFQINRRFARVLRLSNEWIDEISDPNSLVAEIQESLVYADILTFLQLPPDTRPKFTYPMQWENLAVLEISTYENWLKNLVRQSVRNKLRKSARMGVGVRLESFSDRLAAGLVELFNEVPYRRGKRYPCYGWDIEKVKQGWGTKLDRSLWLVAYYGDELIGFIKLILGKRTARTSGTVAKEAHRDKAVMNALFAKAVDICASKDIPFLIYGRYTYGCKGEDGLTAFKDAIGFRKVDIPRYYVPLTRRGRIVLKLGLHQGLEAMIPGSALRLLLKTRLGFFRGFNQKSEKHASDRT